jgi:hypothetical protein
MNVKELKEHLSTFPDELEVVIETYDYWIHQDVYKFVEVDPVAEKHFELNPKDKLQIRTCFKYRYGTLADVEDK